MARTHAAHIMERQGSRYDREMKARALALVASGGTAAGVGRELGISNSTVARWVQRYTGENDNEQWQADNAAVIARSTELLMDGLDQTEERGEAYKSLIALNAIRGTAIDKQSSTRGGTINVIALVTDRAAAIQATIEAEYKVLSEGEPASE